MAPNLNLAISPVKHILQIIFVDRKKRRVYISLMTTAINKAIEYYGSQAALARACGVSQMAVSKWTRHGVPPERALQIEKLTDGAVTRQDLRPDLFGLAALER